MFRGFRALSLTLLVLAALVGALLAWALFSSSGRQAVLERALDALRVRTGIEASVSDFSYRPRLGRLELDDLVLAAAPDAAPFFSARRATAEASIWEILQGRYRLRLLEVEEPRIDLEAPLPESRNDEESSGPPPDVAIDELRIRGGRLQGDAFARIEDWKVEGFSVHGALQDDVLAVDLRADALRLAAQGGEHMLESLRGEARLAVLPSFAPRSFTLTAEPEIELRVVESGGVLDVEAEGRLPLSLLALAGLDPALLRTYDLAEGEAGFALTGRVDPVNLETVQVDGRLDLRRRGVRLVDLDLRAMEEPERVGLSVDARVLPDFAGVRRAQATAGASTWQEFAEQAENGALALEESKVELSVPDLRRLLVRLREEGIEARPLEDLLVLMERGSPGLSVSLSADLSGDLMRPVTRAEVILRRGAEVLLVADLDADPQVGDAWVMVARGELLLDEPGRRAFRGELHAAGLDALSEAELRDGYVRLEQNVEALLDLRARHPETAPFFDVLPERLLVGDAVVDGEFSGRLGALDWKIAASLQENRQGDDSSLNLDAFGSLSQEDAFLKVESEGEFRALGFDLGRLELKTEQGDLTGRADADLRWEGVFRSDLSEIPDLRLTAHAEDVALSDSPDRVRTLDVDLDYLEGRAVIHALHADLGGARLDGWRVEASGDLETAKPLRRADLFLAALSTERRVEIDLRLADEQLSADLRDSVVRGRARAVLPFAALGEIPQLADAVAEWLPEPSKEPVLRLEIEDVDLAVLDEVFDLTPPGTDFGGTLAADLSADVRRLTAVPRLLEVSGDVSIDDFVVVTPRVDLAAQDRLRLSLTGSEMILAPAWLQASETLGASETLAVSGRARWDPSWTLEQEPLRLVEDVRLEAHGAFLADVLAPWLPGIEVDGPLGLNLSVEGSPRDLIVSARLDGARARFAVTAPYPSELTDFFASLATAPGEDVRVALTGKLNQGEIDLEGRGNLAGDWLFDAEARGVRYRLDHGLRTLLDADLQWRDPAAASGEPGRLSGKIRLHRADLRSDVALTRELTAMIFSPSLQSLEPGEIDDMELDLTVSTDEGLWVRNNLADLHADWSSLTVRGVLSEPVLGGRVDIDSGGRLRLYGQTVQIDQATIEFPGRAGEQPRFDIQTANSLQDADVGRPTSELWTWDSTRSAAEGQGAVRVADAVAEGLQNYYADRLLGSVGSSLGTEIRLAPLMILGETDPEARLTITQRLSHQFSVGASFDLRSTDQTYLLEAQNLPQAPRFLFQGFSNDEEEPGAAGQQTLVFGGSAPEEEVKVREIEVETSEGPQPYAAELLPERKIRRAAGLSKGDPVDVDAAFEIGLDVSDSLRREGFPAAEAEVEITPDDEGRGADLLLRVRPGPPVRVRFEGLPLPRATRRTISNMFRTGLRGPESRESQTMETRSMQEMSREAERVLRAKGWLSPRVEVDAAPDPELGMHGRAVTVRGFAERKLDPREPRFPDLPKDAAVRMEKRFSSPLAQSELTAAFLGDPERIEIARRQVLEGLRELGWNEAKILGAELDEDERLLIRLDPGPRQEIVEVELRGVESEHRERLEGLAAIPTGAPADRRRARSLASVLETDLRSRGHSEAQVRAHFEPQDGESAGDAASRRQRLVFVVSAGPSYRIAEVDFEGLLTSREAWVRRTAAVEPGALLIDRELGAARRRLHQTNIFERVATQIETHEDGSADVVFRLDERARWYLAYGARWENGEGFGAVLDVVDRNLFGRGFSLGLRALAGPDIQRARLYSTVDRLRGTDQILEALIEGGEEKIENTLESRFSASIQHTVPVRANLRFRSYGVYLDRKLRETLPSGEVEERRVLSPILGAQLLWDTRTDPLSLEKGAEGHFLSIDFSGSHSSFGSDFDAYGVFAQGMLFRHFGAEEQLGRVWAQAIRVNALSSEGDRLPRVDRLFAGGPNSVRGYPRNSLGPRSPEGAGLGGELLVVINQELRFPLPGILRGRFSGVAFFDAGNVWSEIEDFDGELFTASGLGLRMTTPIGPIRLDVAVPLNPRPDDPGYRVYFGYGQAF